MHQNPMADHLNWNNSPAACVRMALETRSIIECPTKHFEATLVCFSYPFPEQICISANINIIVLCQNHFINFFKIPDIGIFSPFRWIKLLLS